MTTAAPAQNYDNHRKFVPGFHGIAFGILAINFFYSLYAVVTAFSVASVIALLLAFGLIMVMLYARLFALSAQDRVIRLEERLRLQALLPPEQKDTIDKLTTAQLIALRFASDDEVGALAATVIAEGIENRDEIKKRVTNWRPDHQRL
jgi:uncharacterized membrane protein YciS (DUF1049 family)